MEKQNNLWTEEEVTLLKFYYTIKDSKSWREIAEEIKSYTGIERTTTALMSKVNKMKDTFTKKDMEDLYKDLVIGVKNTAYSKKFRRFVMNKFAKYYGDPNDIQEDYAESKIKMQEAAKEDVVETIVDFDQYHHTEDEYSEFKFSDYMYQITLWTIGIIVSVIIIYIIFNNV